MNLFHKRKANQGVVGVQFNAEGVALVQSSNPGLKGAAPALSVCEWLPDPDPAHQQQRLEDRVEQLGLRRQPCRLVLSREDISLLLVEAPAVPDSELRDALRWRIRELIDFPVEQAVVDAFLLPEDRQRVGRRMAYVAVARRELIARRIEQMADARLSLSVIDIPELALRNLVHRLGATGRGAALVALGGGSGALHIVRDNDLHLARRFNVPYEGGLLEDLPEEVLLLEIQRSLDYFERQMRQPPPARIWLSGENVTQDKVLATLADGLPMPVEALALEDWITAPADVQPHTLALCAEAIGTALCRPDSPPSRELKSSRERKNSPERKSSPELKNSPELRNSPELKNSEVNRAAG